MDAHVEIQRTAARFVREKLPVLRDDSTARPRWRELAQLGLVGLALPEPFGAGLGFRELGTVLIECGRNLAPLPWPTITLCARALANHPLAEELLPGVCSGERIVAFAHEEGPRHTRSPALHAERTPSGYRLRGQKRLVLDAHVADGFVVTTREKIFYVAAAQQVDARRLIDGRTAATVNFDVEVPEDHVLNADLHALLDGAALLQAAEMLGGLEAVFEQTLTYLKTRKQFGVPIGSFQALKHRAAAIATERELLRAVVEEALAAHDRQDAQWPQLACAAKARASDAFLLASAEAIQMHGGIGVTDELDVGFYYKRARVAELMLGDGAFWRERYAQLEGY